MGSAALRSNPEAPPRVMSASQRVGAAQPGLASRTHFASGYDRLVSKGSDVRSTPSQKKSGEIDEK